MVGDEDALSDTIAAVATPTGEGALSVVRISGVDVLECARRLLQIAAFDFAQARNCELRIETLEPRRAYHGWIVHPETAAPVDEVVMTYWKGPHSYTGEDVVEISGHGGRVATKKLLEAVLASGVRLAEPGEFTQRAFLNGRMDLAQAEAVADVIRAKTDLAWEAGLRQLQGRLSREIHRLRDLLTDWLAHVEASIDFSEEPIALLGVEASRARCDEMLGIVRHWLSDSARGRLAREGLSLALVGRPNVGKSSLFNALLREDRAIVTPEPGTTRDVIEAEANFNGWWVRLSDTAGIRSTPDEIEQLGVRRSEVILEKADTVLWVVDGSVPFHQEDAAVRNRLPKDRTIVAMNKSDLPQVIEPAIVQNGSAWPVIAVSAKTESGLEELIAEITKLRWADTPEAGEPPLVTNLRHIHALKEAEAALLRAQQGLVQGGSEELVSLEIRAALDQVGSIVGAVTTEDVLGRIFSTFCIGK